MDITFLTYLIILPIIFLAGLIDSIAGGGGILSIPAYMIAGLPSHYVLGNNKFSSFFGTAFSSIRFLKHGIVDVKVAVISAIFALIGSYFGSKTILLLDPKIVKYLLLIFIPIITVISILKKNIGHKNLAHKELLIKQLFLAASVGFFIGFYDGFFGPGTGTLLIIAYTLILKYDLKTANGNTKIVNMSSNIAALINFVIHGKILYKIGIPAMIVGIFGNYLGSKFVIKKGANIIKPVMIIVLTGLLAKILYDFLK